jgi:hypothetical protein
VLFISIHRGKIGGKEIQATRNALIKVFFLKKFNKIFNEIKKKKPYFRKRNTI